ncbi:MAG: S-layer homology domain-containing protein [Clostridiales bacterium]|nr:S-layer homology domain-containing protein [Clostridiales bacterium]
MKKMIAIVLVITLCVQFCVVALAADGDVSDWAALEVAEAELLELIPPYFYFGTDYQERTTRAEFAAIAIYFLAAQHNMEPLDFLYAYSYADFNEVVYAPPSMFTDTKSTEGSAWNDTLVRWAHELGVVEGRGEGIFDPHGYITRQEAAKMLFKVYDTFAETDVSSSAIHVEEYSDVEAIAEWARPAVSFLRGYGIMCGMGGNRFEPDAYYTREQSLATFVRLFNDAPVSRAHGNFAPLITFEDVVQSVMNAELFHVYVRLDLADCTVVYGEQTGVPNGSALLWVLYKSGERLNLLNGLHTPYVNNDFHPTDIRVSEDGTKLIFRRKNIRNENGSYSDYDGPEYYEFDFALRELTLIS